MKFIFLILTFLIFSGCNGKGSGNQQVDTQTYGLQLNIVAGNNQKAPANSAYPIKLTVALNNELSTTQGSQVPIVFSEQTSTGVIFDSHSAGITTIPTDNTGVAATTVTAPNLNGADIVIRAHVSNAPNVYTDFHLQTN